MIADVETDSSPAAIVTLAGSVNMSASDDDSATVTESDISPVRSTVTTTVCPDTTGLGSTLISRADGGGESGGSTVKVVVAL